MKPQSTAARICFRGKVLECVTTFPAEFHDLANGLITHISKSLTGEWANDYNCACKEPTLTRPDSLKLSCAFLRDVVLHLGHHHFLSPIEKPRRKKKTLAWMTGGLSVTSTSQPIHPTWIIWAAMMGLDFLLYKTKVSLPKLSLIVHVFRERVSGAG